MRAKKQTPEFNNRRFLRGVNVQSLSVLIIDNSSIHACQLELSFRLVLKFDERNINKVNTVPRALRQIENSSEAGKKITFVLVNTDMHFNDEKSALETIQDKLKDSNN